MKKIIYYGILFVLFIAIWLLVSVVLVAIGVSPIAFGTFGYRIGGTMPSIPLMMISLGVVQISRPTVYRICFREIATFHKTSATVLILIGVIWYGIVVGAKFFKQHVEKQLIERYEDAGTKND